MRLPIHDFNLNSVERLLIETALRQTGSIVEAAKLLGTTRQGVKRRIIKHRISWPRLPVEPLAATAAIASSPPSTLPQPLAAASEARANALRAFSWFSALAPRRVWREEVADALAAIEAMQDEGRSRWQIRLKIWSTIFWVILNGLREIVGGLTGRK